MYLQNTCERPYYKYAERDAYGKAFCKVYSRGSIRDRGREGVGDIGMNNSGNKNHPLFISQGPAVKCQPYREINFFPTRIHSMQPIGAEFDEQEENVDPPLFSPEKTEEGGTLLSYLATEM